MHIARGLEKLTPEVIAQAMQVTLENQMTGIDGRAGLLSQLSRALADNEEFFGSEGRPGNVIGIPL